MIDTQTIEAIHAHLDEHPTDWQARRELADLLEDAGELDQAKLQRWLVEHRKAPAVWWGRAASGRYHPWHWWHSDGFGPNRSDCIGDLVYRLESFDEGYLTRSIAESDLLRAIDWLAPDISTQEVTC